MDDERSSSSCLRHQDFRQIIFRLGSLFCYKSHICTTFGGWARISKPDLWDFLRRGAAIFISAVWHVTASASVATYIRIRESGFLNSSYILLLSPSRSVAWYSTTVISGLSKLSASSVEYPFLSSGQCRNASLFWCRKYNDLLNSLWCGLRLVCLSEFCGIIKQKIQHPIRGLCSLR